MATTSKKDTQFKPGNQAAIGHGAPAGNTNGFKHGLQRERRKFTVGKLPKGCSWINTLVSTLRRELEALTMDVHGIVGAKEALLIQSSCRHEQAALLAQRWLRLEAHNMSHGERLQYLQAVAAESDKRDKCVERLNLDSQPQTIIQNLYASQTALEAEHDPEDQPKPSNAPAGRTEPETEINP